MTDEPAVPTFADFMHIPIRKAVAELESLGSEGTVVFAFRRSEIEEGKYEWTFRAFTSDEATVTLPEVYGLLMQVLQSPTTEMTLMDNPDMIQ